MQKIIEINNLNITFGNKKLFENYSLQINQGETLGIYAPTGKGKTTLLNYIAQNYYKIIKISYAYQDNRLLLNKTVLQNINFIIPKDKFNHYNCQQYSKKQNHKRYQQQNRIASPRFRTSEQKKYTM